MMNWDLGGSTRSHLCCKDLGISVFFGAGLVFELTQKPEVSEESERRTHFFFNQQKKRRNERKSDPIFDVLRSVGFFRDLLGALLRIVVDLPNLAKCRRLREASEMPKFWTRKIPTNLLQILQILECLPTACYSESLNDVGCNLRSINLAGTPFAYKVALLRSKSGSTKNHPNPSESAMHFVQKVASFCFACQTVMLKRYSWKMLWALKRLGLFGTLDQIHRSFWCQLWCQWHTCGMHRFHVMTTKLAQPVVKLSVLEWCA